MSDDGTMEIMTKTMVVVAIRDENGLGCLLETLGLDCLTYLL